MLKSWVAREGRALVLKVGGQSVAPMAYVTYNPAQGRYGQFAGQGIQLFSVAVYMGDRGINALSGIRPFRPGFWRGEGQYDFSAVEEDYRRIVEAVPGALIFPRIHFDVPVWWEEAHPGEAARDFHGTPLRQSFSSRLWLEACGRALEEYYAWLACSGFEDHVAGCQVAAGSTEEWIYHHTYPGQLLDYSEVNRAAFAAWLREAYGGDLCALNAAWGVGLSRFEDAPIPSPLERKHAVRGDVRDAALERPAIDYGRFHSLSVARAVVALCGEVKRVTGGMHAAGAFYGYVLELVDPDYGHHALGEVLESPCVDFLASPFSYMHARAAGQDWPMMAPVESVGAHGKMWFVEADVRTCLTRFMKETMPYAVPAGNRNYEAAVWKGPETKALSLGAMGKAFASALTRGTALWWFDMWAGWYDDPDFLGFIGKAREIYAETMLGGGGPAAAEIAVVVDETAFRLLRGAAEATRRAFADLRHELGFLGAPYHCYLLSDLHAIPAEQYRMVVFPNAVSLDNEAKALVDRRLARDRRTLLWLGLAAEPAGGDTGYARWRAVDTDALAGQAVYALSSNEDGVQLAAIRRAGHTVALAAQPCLGAAALRELALLSGVHVYCHGGDVVYAGNGFVAVHAASSGAKRVYLPGRSDGDCLFGGAGDFRNVLYHDFSMELGDTALWRVGPAGAGA